MAAEELRHAQAGHEARGSLPTEVEAPEVLGALLSQAADQGPLERTQQRKAKWGRGYAKDMREAAQVKLAERTVQLMDCVLFRHSLTQAEAQEVSQVKSRHLLLAPWAVE